MLKKEINKTLTHSFLLDEESLNAKKELSAMGFSVSKLIRETLISKLQEIKEIQAEIKARKA